MKYFSRHSFGKILSINKSNVEVENLDGVKWTVGKDIFENEFNVSGQFTSEKTVSKTELVETLIKNSFTIMSVTFNKQVKESEVKKKLHALYPNKGNIISEADFKARCNDVLTEVLNGESRTIVGYHMGKTDQNGRVYFFDMETLSDDVKLPEFRLVDPRGLTEVIVKNEKFTLKG